MKRDINLPPVGLSPMGMPINPLSNTRGIEPGSSHCSGMLFKALSESRIIQFDKTMQSNPRAHIEGKTRTKKSRYILYPISTNMQWKPWSYLAGMIL